MPRHATQTSFKPGHVRTPESIAKQRETLLRKYASGELIAAATGKKVAPEVVRKRAESLRRSCLGNRSRTRHGYIQIQTMSGRRYEHRVVMEQFLGRPLKRDEIVHHKNRDKTDNSLDNLELISPSEHSKEHYPEIAHKFRFDASLQPGQWSRKYSACTTCSRVDSPHAGHGICHRCDQRRRNRLKSRGAAQAS